MSIELKIDGQIYNGWKSANVSRALNCMASSFDLVVSDRFIGSKQNIPLDAECQILIDGVPAVTGWLDEITPSYSATSHEVTFAGRSKTCDLVDCSAIIDTGQIIGGTPKEIIEKVIAPFGIKLVFSADQSLPLVSDFQVEPGETAQSIIEKVCKQTGLVYTDDANGNLVVQSIGSGFSSGRLIHRVGDGAGNNILSGRGKYSSRNIFRDYYVKSQMAGSDDSGGEDITGIEGHAVDSDVTRYRPLVLTGENAMDAATAQTRAEWERSNRRAKGQPFEFTVQGWRNANGQLWAPNSYVSVKDDFIRVVGKLIISAVKLSTGSGTTTSLQLSPPDAFILSSADQPIKTYQGWKELREGV